MSMKAYSQKVSELLRLRERDPTMNIDLDNLSCRLFDYLDNEYSNGPDRPQFRSVRTRRWILARLAEISSCDSTVRDMVTTGHLAKLVSRLSYYSPSDKPGLLGLPNRLFDQISLRERASRTANFPVSATLLSSPKAVQMLREEDKHDEGS